MAMRKGARVTASYELAMQDAFCLTCDVEHLRPKRIDDTHPTGRHSEIPLATASLLTNDAHPSKSLEGEQFDLLDGNVAAQPVEECSSLYVPLLRPAFLYVNAIKPSPDSPIGLNFEESEDGTVKVSEVVPRGLFHGSGVHVGDQVVAINNVDCSAASLDAIVNAVQASKSIISFTLYNKGGDPRFVLSSVQKTAPGIKSGVHFRMKQGALIVTRVNEHGFFASSLLMPDHRCFYINGEHCDNKAAQEAANLTIFSDRVTIVSQPRGNLASVISATPDSEPRKWTFFRTRTANSSCPLHFAPRRTTPNNMRLRR